MLGPVAAVGRRLVRRPIRRTGAMRKRSRATAAPAAYFTSRQFVCLGLAVGLSPSCCAADQPSPSASPASELRGRLSTFDVRVPMRNPRHGMRRGLGRLPRETAAASYKRMVAARAVPAAAEGRRHASLEEQRRHRTHTPSPRVYTAGPASASAVARSLRRGMCFRQPTAARE